MYLEQRLHPKGVAVEISAVKVDGRVSLRYPRRSRPVHEPGHVKQQEVTTEETHGKTAPYILQERGTRQ